jgi:hypothetical protein
VVHYIIYIVNEHILRLYLSNDVFEIVIEVVFEVIFFENVLKYFFKFIFNIDISKKLKNTKNI